MKGIFTNSEEKSKSSVKQFNFVMMQLRKLVNHPYMLEGVEDQTQNEFGEHLVENCPKLKFLDKLFTKVKKQGEQAILFSCFTSMLNILEDYCTMRDFTYCRLDGSTDLEERESQIREFSSPGSKYMIFLISTRAGGLGINLVTANHVVLYDSDFNPMVDI